MSSKLRVRGERGGRGGADRRTGGRDAGGRTGCLVQRRLRIRLWRDRRDESAGAGHGLPDLQQQHRKELRRHRAGHPGTSRPMVARVSLSTSPTWIQDVGNYTTYAGPVYVSAKSKCIDWGGEISGVGSYEWNSHCG